MSGPQLLYGIRDGELIHVDDAERGQACACTCYECGHSLVAKKGNILAHFFAHEAMEIDCNPAPESLVHLYTKEQVAKMVRLRLPGFTVEGRHQAPDSVVHSLHWRYVPHYDVDVKRAEVESHKHLGVVPDVLVSDTDGLFLAVEVFYRHAVDTEKLEKLKRLPFSAVEVNVSDLPVTISAADLQTALRQVSRWTWLTNRHQLAHESRLTHQLENSLRFTKIQPPPKEPVTSNSSIPSRMIADACANATIVSVARLVAKLKNAPTSEITLELHHLSREVRLALHCHWIGVSPAQLPVHLMQAVTRQSVYGSMPAILWQTGVFAKFCMSGKAAVTAQQAAFWIRRTFPGLHSIRALQSSANNLNEYSEATFNFLNHLAEQRLMERVQGKRPWTSTFRPVASTRAEVRARLLEYPPAKRQRPE
jgi:hypothetical protein